MKKENNGVANMTHLDTMHARGQQSRDVLDKPPSRCPEEEGQRIKHDKRGERQPDDWPNHRIETR